MVIPCASDDDWRRRVLFDLVSATDGNDCHSTTGTSKTRVPEMTQLLRHPALLDMRNHNYNEPGDCALHYFWEEGRYSSVLAETLSSEDDESV